MKPSNCWKRITFGEKLQEKTRNQDFSDSWQHGGVIITCTLRKSHRLVLSWIHVASETKAWKKHGAINRKFSNARKTQNFTCWALTKLHPYCLRTLKSTDYHICLKFWTFRFDLRKKTFANQTSQNEIWQFWTSKCQPAQSGGVFKGLFYKEKTEAREKMDTESMDEWSLERMKEQDPRWERVERSFW